jgi:transcriptional regulator with XRE-family HTH domain
VGPDAIHSRRDLAQALTALRSQSGLTVRELARRLDTPVATVGDYVGGRHLPGPAQLTLFKALLRECGVDEQLRRRRGRSGAGRAAARGARAWESEIKARLLNGLEGLGFPRRSATRYGVEIVAAAPSAARKSAWSSTTSFLSRGAGPTHHETFSLSARVVTVVRARGSDLPHAHRWAMSYDTWVAKSRRSSGPRQRHWGAYLARASRPSPLDRSISRSPAATASSSSSRPKAPRRLVDHSDEAAVSVEPNGEPGIASPYFPVSLRCVRTRAGAFKSSDDGGVGGHRKW